MYGCPGDAHAFAIGLPTMPVLHATETSNNDGSWASLVSVIMSVLLIVGTYSTPRVRVVPSGRVQSLEHCVYVQGWPGLLHIVGLGVPSKPA